MKHPARNVDPIVTALVALVREVAAKRAEERDERRRTMRVVDDKRGGRAA